jgi:hypothetical protein
MNKWNGKFWQGFGERVGASAVGGVLTMVTADATGVADYSQRAWWVLVGIPTVTSICKGLLANLKGDQPSPSLVGGDESSY